MPDAFHFWLLLLGIWSATAFAAHLKTVGIGVVVSNALCVVINPRQLFEFFLAALLLAVMLKKHVSTLETL